MSAIDPGWLLLSSHRIHQTKKLLKMAFFQIKFLYTKLHLHFSGASYAVKCVDWKRQRQPPYEPQVAIGNLPVFHCTQVQDFAICLHRQIAPMFMFWI